MIDTATEQLLTLQQAADRMPISRVVVRFISPRSAMDQSSKLEGVRLGEGGERRSRRFRRFAERETLAALGKLPVARSARPDHGAEACDRAPSLKRN